MDDLSVSEVKISLNGGDDGRVLGWASCVLGVRTDDGTLRLSYPCIRNRNEQRYFHFNPISREAQRVFEAAIPWQTARGLVMIRKKCWMVRGIAAAGRGRHVDGDPA